MRLGSLGLERYSTAAAPETVAAWRVEVGGVTLWHNPACGTSRRVLEAVRAAGHEPTVVEYLKVGWTRAELGRLLSYADVCWRMLMYADVC